MGDLIQRYMVCGIQYSPVELHVGPEATKRNLKRMKDYFEYTYEQYSDTADASCTDYAKQIKVIAYPEYATTGYPAGTMEEAVTSATDSAATTHTAQASRGHCKGRMSRVQTCHSLAPSVRA